MAALPKLGWGGDRRVKVYDHTLTSDLEYRRSRAAVSRVIQSNADAVHAWGDADLIDRIRAGDVSVSDAFKGIKAAKRADREAEQAAEARGRRTDLLTAVNKLGLPRDQVSHLRKTYGGLGWEEVLAQ